VPDYWIPYNPVQPSGSHNLDDGDARLSACVYRVHDVLYAVHSAQIGDRAAIQWFRIDAINSVVLESGLISDTNLDLFYPAIAANQYGTVVIVCNGCSLDTYVSCYAVVAQPLNGSLTFGDLTLLKSGSASYRYSSSGISRWGDYSALAPDPSDPCRFWSLTMYPADSTTWATQITELIAAPQETLAIAPSGTNVVLSWPGDACGYHLQSTLDLSNPDWRCVPQYPILTNGQFTLTLPANNRSILFRLIR